MITYALSNKAVLRRLLEPGQNAALKDQARRQVGPHLTTDILLPAFVSARGAPTS